MKLLTRLDAPLQLPSPVLTVGTFDGVHLGHRAILDTVCREARRRNGSSVAITFDRHPRSVIAPESAPLLLMSREEKLRELRTAGVEVLIELPFTLEFSRTKPEVFVEQLIVRKIGAVAVVEGDDHGFGRGRKGDVSTLQALSGRFGFEFIQVGPKFVDGAPVNSTRLRDLIAAGRMEDAIRLLGRPYGLLGEVVRGDGRGREIGFPTANVRPDAPDKLLPGNGVYAVQVRLDERCMGGAANVGSRPTFDGAGRSVEVHLFDFSGDLYGRDIEVAFLSRLREERKFDGVQGLVAQIHEDVKVARQRLKAISLSQGHIAA
ncbi:MAG: bifunctional riboflavin kinase/FAD synthetase [Candidatus Latescibacteria bacterium]|nr:bifunctional riboflavin kinase/FAD synthetase [Candidatus Latescibacterota bacterium]